MTVFLGKGARGGRKELINKLLLAFLLIILIHFSFSIVVSNWARLVGNFVRHWLGYTTIWKWGQSLGFLLSFFCSCGHNANIFRRETNNLTRIYYFRLFVKFFTVLLYPSFPKRWFLCRKPKLTSEMFDYETFPVRQQTWLTLLLKNWP